MKWKLIQLPLHPLRSCLINALDPATYDAYEAYPYLYGNIFSISSKKEFDKKDFVTVRHRTLTKITKKEMREFDTTKEVFRFFF